MVYSFNPKPKILCLKEPLSTPFYHNVKDIYRSLYEPLSTKVYTKSMVSAI